MLTACVRVCMRERLAGRWRRKKTQNHENPHVYLYGLYVLELYLAADLDASTPKSGTPITPLPSPLHSKGAITDPIEHSCVGVCLLLWQITLPSAAERGVDMDMDIDVDMDMDNRHGTLYVQPCICIFMVCLVCVRVMSLVRPSVRPSVCLCGCYSATYETAGGCRDAWMGGWDQDEAALLRRVGNHHSYLAKLPTYQPASIGVYWLSYGS